VRVAYQPQQAGDEGLRFQRREPGGVAASGASHRGKNASDGVVTQAGLGGAPPLDGFHVL